MRPSGQSLQTNLGDWCIRICISAWASWTVACEGPGSRHAGPRSVITHRLSWVQWSMGCKTLSSYRLEGLALLYSSPVGLQSLHARQGHRLPSLRWSGCPWTCGDVRRTESHSRVWWSEGANESDWAALARLPDTVQAAPTEPPMYPQWGSKEERRDLARATSGWSEAGSECEVQRLPGSTVGQRDWLGLVSRAFDDALEPPSAACWQQRRMGVVWVWSVCDQR